APPYRPEQVHSNRISVPLGGRRKTDFRQRFFVSDMMPRTLSSTARVHACHHADPVSVEVPQCDELAADLWLLTHSDLCGTARIRRGTGLPGRRPETPIQPDCRY